MTRVAFQQYEAYVDREAHQVHLASTHFAAWKSAVQDVLVDRAIRKFESVHIPQRSSRASWANK